MAIDTNRGQLGMQALDCVRNPVSGVAFSTDAADASSTSFYFVGSTATHGADHTDSSGLALGGFTNVVPGELKVEETVVATCQRLGTATAFTRPGSITAINMQPTP